MQTSLVLHKDYKSWSWSVPSGLSLGIHHPLRQRPRWPSADLRPLPCGVAPADGGVHMLLHEGGAVLHKWRRDAAKKKKNWPTSRYAWQSAVISETSSPSVKRLSASRVSVDGLR